MNKSDFIDMLNETSKIIHYFNNTPDVDFIHYRTFDELWCDAILLIAKKKLFESIMHAIITFWKKENIFNEEINVKKAISEKDVNKIFETIYSDVMNFEFKNLSKQDFNKEINIVIEGIKKAILNRPGSSQGPIDWNNYDTYWGIFFNNRRISNIEDFYPPIEEEFLNGFFISSEWNNIKLFAETTNQYIYFYWSTGA